MGKKYNITLARTSGLTGQIISSKERLAQDLALAENQRLQSTEEFLRELLQNQDLSDFLYARDDAEAVIFYRPNSGDIQSKADRISITKEGIRIYRQDASVTVPTKSLPYSTTEFKGIKVHTYAKEAADPAEFPTAYDVYKITEHGGIASESTPKTIRQVLGSEIFKAATLEEMDITLCQSLETIAQNYVRR